MFLFLYLLHGMYGLQNLRRISFVSTMQQCYEYDACKGTSAECVGEPFDISLVREFIRRVPSLFPSAFLSHPFKDRKTYQL